MRLLQFVRNDRKVYCINFTPTLVLPPQGEETGQENNPSGGGDKIDYSSPQ